MSETHRISLAARGEVTPAGEFEILAITAGEGNGWRFPAEVLQASLALWENVECFVDHGGGGGRSIRDLGGVLSQARWNAQEQGIQARLAAIGPAAPIVEATGRQVLALARQGQAARPRVGFSADIEFSASRRLVERIVRVHSVDLVYQPARGGQFIEMLEEKGETMTETISMSWAAADEPVRTHLQTVPASPPAAGELEAARSARQQMCTYLLDAGLAASHLPAALQEHVRRQFAGQLFEPPALEAAIGEARQLLTGLTGGQSVTGPAGARPAGGGHAYGVTGMFSSEDQVQAAVDDLFGVERSAGLGQARPPRLSGIRELYLMLTGDDELHGGYYPSRARLASSADFTGLVKNAMNKIVANQWELLGRAGYDWWSRVTVQENFSSLQSITGTLVGTVGTLPAVAEGAEYTELAIGDSPETASFTKYGGYIPLTLELIDRDETCKLRAYPRELANAGLRRISSLVGAVFTDNSGAGPTLADGGALFNATAVTTAGGHANLLTTALSAAQWETVGQAVYNQPMLVKNASGYYGSGAKQAVNPRYLLVPRALDLTARKVLYPYWDSADNRHSENLQQGSPGDVVVVPEWTDANDWAAACDPRIAPAIFIGTRFGIMPEVFIASNELSPAVFMNDEHRLKVRHFIAVWVNDFRPLHKSSV